jgi:hypothetical protein
VRITHEVAKTTASTDVPFEVRGREVAPSDTLAVRDFRFDREEDEREPLEKPAYRPGDSVWARFDLIGYQFGEGNRVDVAYGVAVMDADGEGALVAGRGGCPALAVVLSQALRPPGR